MRRRSPWTWPACLGLALVLTGLAFLFTPRSWIFLLPGAGAGAKGMTRQGSRPWLDILPPLDIEVVARIPEDPARPDIRPVAPPEDPRWWTEGWRVRTVTAVQADSSVPAPVDSIQILLQMLGAPPDILQAVRPDSVLASHLFFGRLEDSFAFEELKPYLAAMGRSEDYRDILSRAADLYDDFLHQEIITPD